MKASEKMAKRLEEIDRQRGAEQREIEKRIEAYQAARQAAEDEMQRTQDNPDTLKEYAAAKLQAEEAAAQIETLRQHWQAIGRQKNAVVTHEETRELLRELRAEAVAENIQHTQRALTLLQELFDIGRSAYLADERRDFLITEWQSKVDPATPAASEILCGTQIDSRLTQRYRDAVYQTIFGCPLVDEESTHAKEALDRLTGRVKNYEVDTPWIPPKVYDEHNRPLNPSYVKIWL